MSSLNLLSVSVNYLSNLYRNFVSRMLYVNLCNQANYNENLYIYRFGVVENSRYRSRKHISVLTAQSTCDKQTKRHTKRHSTSFRFVEMSDLLKPVLKLFCVSQGRLFSDGLCLDVLKLSLSTQHLTLKPN